MKNTLFALVALALLLGSVPVVEADHWSASTTPSHYSSTIGKTWPLWIGRIDNRYYTYKLRPEMAQKYLPLSLIKTGGMADLIREVESTPNVDTTNWPNWIGELK